MSIAPLILTIKFDPLSFSYLNSLREAHFPANRNYLSAHLTLFHHLPGEHETQIRDELVRLCHHHELIPMQISGLRFLGYGVALTIASEQLVALRNGLAKIWSNWLTLQDGQKFQPHVTIQNKVPATQAKALFQDLKATFIPIPATAVGLCLWRYCGGPWELANEWLFDGHRTI